MTYCLTSFTNPNGPAPFHERGRYFHLKPYFIPTATPAEQAPIIALVEQVLAAKATGEPTATLEADIDALVAARYGLTPAEAAQL